MPRFVMPRFVMWVVAVLVGAAGAVAASPPDEVFVVHLSSLTVCHRPGEGVEVATDGRVLSSGSSWSVKRIAEGLWHLRHSRWQEMYWRVDGNAGSVATVRGGVFGAEGGRRSPLDAEVATDSHGGFVISFAAHAEPKLTYASAGVEVTVADTVVSSGATWQARELDVVVFQLRQKTWEEVLWLVDLGQGQVREVSGGVFGMAGGAGTPLPYEVTSPRIASVAKVTVLRTPVPEVERLTVHLPSVDVAVDASSGTAQVSVRGTALDTTDWQVREVAPGVIHLRRPGWSGQHWRLDTGEREAFVVSGARFGASGGSERRLPARITRTTEGAWRFSFGSDADPHLSFIRASDRLEVAVDGQIVAGGSSWTARRVRPHLFHFKHAQWKRFFWSVNTQSKRVAQVSGGPFGVSPERIYGGGAGITEDPLPFRVTSE